MPQKVNLPSCVAWRPLCHKVNLPSCVAWRPLCHKVNLPNCVAWWPFGVIQSKSTELCSSSAATVPQSKSTKLCSSAAPFHHDLGYFRHRTNKHLAPLKSLTSTYFTKLLKKLYWCEHTHSTGGFDDSLAMFERCSVSETVFKPIHCAPAFTSKNVVLGP